MAEVARKVESYNLAYQLAWKHISEDEKRKQPNIARLLNSIRRQLSEGATEPVFIASEALADVGERLDRESDDEFQGAIIS
ncbi:MAG: hypothetical protein WCF15_18635, partial [Pseudolabrys sp.]